MEENELTSKVILGFAFIILFLQQCLSLSKLFTLLALILISFGIVFKDDSENIRDIVKKIGALFLICLFSDCFFQWVELDIQTGQSFMKLLSDSLYQIVSGNGINWIFPVMWLFEVFHILVKDNKGVMSAILFIIGLLLLLNDIQLPVNLTLALTAMAGSFAGKLVKNNFKVKFYPLSRLGNHFLDFVIAFACDRIFQMAYNIGNIYISCILRFIMLIVSAEAIIYFKNIFIKKDPDDQKLYCKVRNFLNKYQRNLNIAFYVLFGLLFSYQFYRSTMYVTVIQNLGIERVFTLFFEFLTLLMLFMAIISLVMDENHKSLLIKYVLLLTVQIIWHTSWVLEIAIGGFLIVAASGKSQKIILREAVIIGVIIMLAAWAGSAAGMIENVTTWPEKQALGIIYYTDNMAHWFFLYIMSFIAWPRKMYWWRAILYFAGAYGLFTLTGARTGFICMLLFTICMFLFDLIYKNADDFFKHRKVVNIAYLTFLAGVFLSFALVLIFGNDVRGESVLTGSFLSRQQLGMAALKNYPVHLFGNAIIEVGGGAGQDQAIMPYFFVDCSYIRLWIMYGINYFILFLGIHTYLIHKAIQKKNLILIIALIIIAIEGISEHFMTSFEYNILPVILFTTFDILPVRTSVQKL